MAIHEQLGNYLNQPVSGLTEQISNGPPSTLEFTCVEFFSVDEAE